ncbi:hypothetical protein D9757_013446 [Collybiopsis confluens]|uniref:Uncharacterized protein n=1 Tax=Collybiopsis confluens TaxID=2823264 RepID=A0A8H5FQM3_9AGAR|nr:hypothetical protein D9757_013446 [Collybiopsis confluens]
MQFKLAFFTAALATLVAATPGPSNTCSTGPMQCCNTLTSANDPAAAAIIKSIGAVVQDVNVGVGLTCSPVLGVGSGGWPSAVKITAMYKLDLITSKLSDTMSGKALQCAVFEATDAFVSNRARFADGLNLLSGVDGHLATYWGLQVSEEGSKKGVILTLWETSGHYAKFVGSDSYNSGWSILKSAATGEIRRAQFTRVAGSTIPAADAGVTQLALVRPNSGSSQDQIKGAGTKVYSAFESKNLPAVLGETTGSDGFYIFLVGWSSYDESRSTVAGEPFASAIADLRKLASVDVTHAVLDKHT